MKIAVSLAIIMASLTTLISCRHAEDIRLRRVESILEQSPDSALVMLYTLDPTTLVGEEEKAHYAVLLSMACVKLFNP